MVIESGLVHEVDGHYELSGPMTDLAIPSTLQDSLTARLDRLGEVKEVVQLASVLGREFIYRLIQAVSLRDDAPLSDHLRQLVSGEFLYQQGVVPEASFIFKHALIQDAAYNSLLISRRQQYHQLVARVYEESFPEIIESQPALVAHHYTEAGLNQEAIPHWQQSGLNAMRRSANVEAVNHLSKGLELLESLPESSERATQEVALQTMLAQSQVQIRGYTAPEVEQAFSRARELIGKIGETPLYFQVMYGLSIFYIGRSEYQSGGEVADQYLAAARLSQDPLPLLMAHRTMGMVMMLKGEIVQARDHLVQGFARYDIQQHRSLALAYGQEPMVTGIMWSSINLFLLGYADQSSTQLHEAVSLAEELAHPFTSAFANCFAAQVSILSRAIEPAIHYADATVSVAEEQSYAHYLAWGNLLQGAYLAHTGQPQEGIERLAQSLATITKTGFLALRSLFLSLLAEAHLIAGQAPDGLDTLDKAFAHANDTGERFWESELHRQKGELLLLRGGSENEAEECFNKALEIARNQSAKSLELRTALSLARLWQSQGKTTDARELLAGIYGWFTEGFGTPDLVDAKVLLEELA